MATRDENTDASKTGPGKSRESAAKPVPNHLVHAELVVNGNMEGTRKERPEG
jgi:hypothetical protein